MANVTQSTDVSVAVPVPLRKSQRLIHQAYWSANPELIISRKKEQIYNHFAYKMRQMIYCNEPYKKTKILIEFYTHFLKHYETIYEHLKNKKKEQKFERLLHTFTIKRKSLDLDKEMENLINDKNYKLKTRLKLFRKLYPMIDEKNKEFINARIDAFGSKVQLNDDVIGHIFSYI
jgi:hypothetical protein